MLSTDGVQWSFGVLLWELLTRGAKPYEGVEPMRMRRYLKDGNRLAKPSPATPDFAYAQNFLPALWNILYSFLLSPHADMNAGNISSTFVAYVVCLSAT